MNNYTSEQISRAIAPYIGATLKNGHVLDGVMIRNKKPYVRFNNGAYVMATDESVQLLLRSIDSLTDEELIKVMGLCNHVVLAGGRSLVTWINNNYIRLPLHAVDYLRSIFIDLPSYHLSGKTLVEAGLATLEGGKG